MRKAKLEKFDHYLEEKLKNPQFNKNYEIEKAKVAVAQKIAEMRQDFHLRQTDLAKKMHVSQQFISQIETAETSNLTLETLLRIASSLGRCVEISFPKASNGSSRLRVA